MTATFLGHQLQLRTALADVVADRGVRRLLEAVLICQPLKNAVNGVLLLLRRLQALPSIASVKPFTDCATSREFS
ncbi:hypothetical protein [Streptomyces sp. NK08204]|uniref:hypothetical protein n=1 Tax=Streptomyces sp. NK08204 TaxID=2873260 RepID=UPI0035A8CB43